MPHYTCPVCGFAWLTSPPNCYEICECCGTQFDTATEGTGEDLDTLKPFSTIRAEWLARGCKWWYPSMRYFNPFFGRF